MRRSILALGRIPWAQEINWDERNPEEGDESE